MADTVTGLQGFLTSLTAGTVAKATQAGQRIYDITQENMATALPNIHHDADTMDEIRAALAVGKEVITHTDAVTVPGWKGAGYIIMDPDTGVGAYKIAGGMNGAFMIVGFFVAMSLIALLLLVIAMAGPLLAGAGVAFGALLVSIGAAASIGTLIASLASSMNEAQTGCFLAGFLLPLWLMGFSSGLEPLIASAAQWLSGIGFVISSSAISACWSW